MIPPVQLVHCYKELLKGDALVFFERVEQRLRDFTYHEDAWGSNPEKVGTVWADEATKLKQDNSKAKIRLTATKEEIQVASTCLFNSLDISVIGESHPDVARRTFMIISQLH